jgi:hypothetical protein
VDGYLFLNRYTGTIYTYADMMVQPKAPSESSKIKNLKKELEIANSKLADKCSMERKLRDEMSQLQKEILKRHKDVYNQAENLCKLIKSYSNTTPGYQVEINGSFYDPNKVWTLIVNSSTLLNDKLKQEAPE